MRALLTIFVILATMLGHPLLAAKSKNKKNKPRASLEPGLGGIQAQGVLLIDGATGKILFQRNPDSRFRPASTTKLLTALTVYDSKGIDGSVTIQKSDTYVEPSSVPLRPGETVSVRDLLNCILISSDNDAAMALARYAGGSVDGFAEMMNAKARSLGCTNSRFTNPSGLPDERMYSSPADLMKIFRAVLAVPELRKMSATAQYPIRTKIGKQTLRHHNKLLRVYPGMSSAKTGWTVRSRHTYAACVKRDGREVYLTLMNSPDKWRDARILFDYAFANLPDTGDRTSPEPKNRPATEDKPATEKKKSGPEVTLRPPAEIEPPVQITPATEPKPASDDKKR